MKAISIAQPWATLIVSGLKPIFSMAWNTRHKEPRLAIHSLNAWHPHTIELMETEDFQLLIRKLGFFSWQDMPIGQILGYADFVDSKHRNEMTKKEERVHSTYGDARYGEWCWVTKNPKRLRQPFAYRGRPGLFEVPSGLIRRGRPFRLVGTRF